MSETLKFKIGLSGTYHGVKTPEYRIAVNGREYAHGFISASSNEPELIEFTTAIDDGDVLLSISFLNKENTDVLKDNYEDPDNFNIIGDLLLNIDSIEIDDIELGNLIFTASKYEPLNLPEMQNCVNLGWNGTYSIKFTTPFYLWLLESM